MALPTVKFKQDIDTRLRPLTPTVQIATDASNLSSCDDPSCRADADPDPHRTDGDDLSGDSGHLELVVYTRNLGAHPNPEHKMRALLIDTWNLTSEGVDTDGSVGALKTLIGSLSIAHRRLSHGHEVWYGVTRTGKQHYSSYLESNNGPVGGGSAFSGRAVILSRSSTQDDPSVSISPVLLALLLSLALRRRDGPFRPA